MVIPVQPSIIWEPESWGFISFPCSELSSNGMLLEDQTMKGPCKKSQWLFYPGRYCLKLVHLIYPKGKAFWGVSLCCRVSNSKTNKAKTCLQEVLIHNWKSQSCLKINLFASVFLFR